MRYQQYVALLCLTIVSMSNLLFCAQPNEKYMRHVIYPGRDWGLVYTHEFQAQMGAILDARRAALVSDLVIEDLTNGPDSIVKDVNVDSSGEELTHRSTPESALSSGISSSVPTLRSCTPEMSVQAAAMQSDETDSCGCCAVIARCFLGKP